jgi:opacity protein-like surface antigen
MRGALFFVSSMLLLASLATAQVPTSGNIFVGYSYNNADWFGSGHSSLNGWTASLEGKVLPHVGIVTDFSQTFGSESVTILCPAPTCPGPENVSAHEYNMLFGPRVSFSVGKLRPFAEALFGVGHISANSDSAVLGSTSDTSFATALGGGVDYRIVRPIALRFEGDYLQTRFFSTTQNSVRLSTGIVFRF